MQTNKYLKQAALNWQLLLLLAIIIALISWQAGLVNGLLWFFFFAFLLFGGPANVLALFSLPFLILAVIFMLAVDYQKAQYLINLAFYLILFSTVLEIFTWLKDRSMFEEIRLVKKLGLLGEQKKYRPLSRAVRIILTFFNIACLAIFWFLFGLPLKGETGSSPMIVLLILLIVVNGSVFAYQRLKK